MINLALNLNLVKLTFIPEACVPLELYVHVDCLMPDQPETGLSRPSQVQLLH